VAQFVFDCIDAVAEPYAAGPTLSFRVRIAETTGTPVHAMALRCQIRIEPQRRRYGTAEAERLQDLFGVPERWSDTLKPLQFANVSTMVGRFTGSTEVALPVPCTYDLEVGPVRYLHSLDDGAIPLLLLYSGIAFLKQDNGFAVEPVPWTAESPYRLPVSVWREMMDGHFPHAGWLRLNLDTIDALGRYKSRHALPTWDVTIRALLAEVLADER
jgi:Family of unknown function (DUF6084)